MKLLTSLPLSFSFRSLSLIFFTHTSHQVSQTIRHFVEIFIMVFGALVVAIAVPNIVIVRFLNIYIYTYILSLVPHHSQTLTWTLFFATTTTKKKTQGVWSVGSNSDVPVLLHHARAALREGCKPEVGQRWQSVAAGACCSGQRAGHHQHGGHHSGHHRKPRPAGVNPWGLAAFLSRTAQCRYTPPHHTLLVLVFIILFYF